MENGVDSVPKPNSTTQSKNNGSSKSKPKVIVIMGATGSGKSRLAIDLASQFPIEIINADSMQVYRGLDILTNKVPFPDQKGVTHHLLGTVPVHLEFTSKNFRDLAIPIVDDIISRNRLPVVVGGTNYYIQALVSPLLLDDATYEDESFSSHHPGDGPTSNFGTEGNISSFNYDHLKNLDPVAARRVHPNDHRKVDQYLQLYARTGVLPSKLFQGKAMENWGRADDFRYNCCFICINASLNVLDQFVDDRVDCMVGAGLLDEVGDIYSPTADYTRGLRQAIGVREFQDFLRVHLSEDGNSEGNNLIERPSKQNIREVLNLPSGGLHRTLLEEAIDKVKINTRRLVRRQKRRISQLQKLFGWKVHYVDATESLSCKSNELWAKNVVILSVEIIKSFVHEDISSSMLDFQGGETCNVDAKVPQRDLWTQYICKACGNRILRGAHEWQQHKQGRSHRKRISNLKKTQQR